MFGKGVAPIELQDEGVDVPVGTEAIVSGWGRLEVIIFPCLLLSMTPVPKL